MAFPLGAVQDGARFDGEPRVGGPASFEQVSDVSFDAFKGSPGSVRRSTVKTQRSG
jgi:hypothetical protein